LIIKVPLNFIARWDCRGSAALTFRRLAAPPAVARCVPIFHERLGIAEKFADRPDQPFQIRIVIKTAVPVRADLEGAEFERQRQQANRMGPRQGIGEPGWDGGHQVGIGDDRGHRRKCGVFT
jgi:hypothetical protein